MTRIIICVISILGCLPSMAEDDPAKLLSLRESWKGAKERSLRPVKEKYLTALIKLRDDLTKQRRLEDAVQVREEIEVLTQGADPKSEETKMPIRLKSLRAVYDRETRRLDEMNDRKYASALKKLQDGYARKGELENALAVGKEISSLSDDKGSVVGQWQLVMNGKIRPGVYMEMYEDGRFEVKGEPQWSGNYRFLNSKRTKIKRTCNNGKVFLIQYDEKTDTLIQEGKASYLRWKSE